MAKRYAVQSGNWSDPATWDGGTLPTTVDDVYANNKVVTVDYNASYPNGYQVLSITNASNASAPTIAAGGYFTPSNGSKLTCTATQGIVNTQGANNAGVYLFSLTGTANAMLVGNVHAAQSNSNYNGGAITLGPSSSGTLNIIGNFTQGNASYMFALLSVNTSSATVNITGSVTKNASDVFVLQGPVKINIVGDIAGGFTGSGGVVLKITGNVLPGGVNLSSSAAEITGTISASSTLHGVVGPSGIFLISGPLISASNGRQPVYAVDWRWAQTNSASYWEIYNSDLTTKRTLYTPDAIPGVPTPANVRDGTVYGTGNALTGSCKVPAAVNVRKDVPVDNTVGTAVLDVSEIWSQAASSMTVTGSIGERLKNAATVQDIGSIWAAG